MKLPSWLTSAPDTEDELIDALIAEKGVQRYAFTGHDERLEQRARRRQEQVEALKVRANKHLTGEAPTMDVLRMAKR